MRITTFKIKGLNVDANVNYRGEFSATVDGEDMTRPTLRALKDAVAGKLSQKKLNLPFIKLERDQLDEMNMHVRKGTVITIHSGNGNLIVQYEDCEGREQFRNWSGDQLLRSDTDPEELLRLARAIDEANEAYLKFIEKHALKVKSAT